MFTFVNIQKVCLTVFGLVVFSDLWGDQGYFKIRMGDKDCGVTTAGGYPVVASNRQHINVATA